MPNINLFGLHKLPCTFNIDGIDLSILSEAGITVYKRIKNQTQIKKEISEPINEILIIPSEPIDINKSLVSHLLIEFVTPLIIGPRTNYKLYIPIPYNIAIYYRNQDSDELTDYFNYDLRKLYLYGDNHSGLLCTYCAVNHSYDNYSSFNESTCFMEININSSSDSSFEIKKLIFNLSGMRIFYNENIIYCRSKVRLLNEKSAETEFLDEPLDHNHLTSYSILSSKRYPFSSNKFVMDSCL